MSRKAAGKKTKKIKLKKIFEKSETFLRRHLSK